MNFLMTSLSHVWALECFEDFQNLERTICCVICSVVKFAGGGSYEPMAHTIVGKDGYKVELSNLTIAGLS